MAVAKELAWTHYKETYAGDAVVLTQYRELLWKVVSFFKTAGAVIVNSSNGAGGAPGGDQWVDSGDLVWATAGSNHSWAVWYFLGRYELWDLANANAYYLGVSACDSSYSTGGTATAAPTSTSSRSVTLNATSAAWACGQTLANKQFVLHGMYCATGLRLIISYGGNTGTIWLWQNPTDVRGVPQPAVLGFRGSATTGLNIGTFNTAKTSLAVSTAITEFALEPAGGWSATQVKLAARDRQANDYYNGWLLEIISGTQDGQQKTITDYDSATNEAVVGAMVGVLSATNEYMLNPRVRSTAISNAYLTVEYDVGGVKTGSVNTADDWDVAAAGTPGPGTWPFCTVRVRCDGTGNRWDRGRIQDLYWGPSANANGQLFDTDLTRDWVQYGDFVVPNDGAVAPVT
jgi:hypothetical protein